MTTPEPENPRPRKRWGFRLAALLFALLPFVLLEGVLIALDKGRPNPAEDPFVGFKAVRPLFTVNSEANQYEIQDEARLEWFYPDSFPVEKAENAFRIFCIGGSTVAGRPFTIETAFSSWLKLYLQEHAPDREWEVVNCGGISYASYRLVPIVEEVLGYNADLIVLYTGHNEFLEDRTYEHVKNLPDAIVKPYQVASKLRTFNFIRHTYMSATGRSPKSAMEARPILAKEVDALLEHEGGMEHYFRDPEWQARVIEHFGYNIERMCLLSKEAGVPLIVMNPSCNLRHTKPFKSEHREDLTEQERERLIAAINAGSAALKEGEFERAVLHYEEAIGVDPLYADAYFQLGIVHDYAGDLKQAYKCYVEAKDLDVCPLRMLEPMHDVLKEVVDRQNAAWLDVRAEVEAIVEGGIPGNKEFLDHVHPNVAGHIFFATLLAKKMKEMGIVDLPEDGWDSMGPVLEQYQRSLPKDYWAQGEMRLENLRHWARGESTTEGKIEQPSRKRQK